MPIWSDHPLSDLLRAFPLTPVDRDAFLRSDAPSVMASVQHLVVAAYCYNAVGVDEFGGRLGPTRGRGPVEQVIAAAFQGIQSVEPHPTPFDKAATLLRGITQGHPFNDGNKRTGFLVAAYYLDIVGVLVPTDFDIDAMEGLCIRLSAGIVRDIDEIADELARLWSSVVR